VATGWEGLTRTHFPEVLAHESACVAGISDKAMLVSLRLRIVEKFVAPRSPFVSALQQAGDLPDRDSFLNQVREVIVDMVDRLWRLGTTLWPSAKAPKSCVDTGKSVVLIPAALNSWRHSKWRLHKTLDHSIPRSCLSHQPRTTAPRERGTSCPVSTMDL
jgi:hypothetical protein